MKRKRPCNRGLENKICKFLLAGLDVVIYSWTDLGVERTSRHRCYGLPNTYFCEKTSSEEQISKKHCVTKFAFRNSERNEGCLSAFGNREGKDLKKPLEKAQGLSI